MYLEHNFKAAVIKFCKPQEDKNYVAVTLTFRGGRSENGQWHHLRQEYCEQNLRHFLNKLNKRVFGNAYRPRKKAGRQLNCLSVLEGDNTVRRHYHLMLELPHGYTINEFGKLIRATWRTTRWGGYEVGVKPADTGWLHYMLKKRSKQNLPDAIDWLNSHKQVRAV